MALQRTIDQAAYQILDIYTRYRDDTGISAIRGNMVTFDVQNVPFDSRHHSLCRPGCAGTQGIHRCHGTGRYLHVCAGVLYILVILDLGGTLSDSIKWQLGVSADTQVGLGRRERCQSAGLSRQAIPSLRCAAASGRNLRQATRMTVSFPMHPFVIFQVCMHIIAGVVLVATCTLPHDSFRTRGHLQERAGDNNKKP